MSETPVLLVVLDGWGINADKNGNAIALARTPVYTSLLADYPHTELLAS
jgi:2,3-bisphosphoglycerate-independent phosphoglycerate mutase